MVGALMSPMDVDLKEPRRAAETPAARHIRQQKLIATVSMFLMAYSLLHKLVIPTFLQFTLLKNSPYAVIDLWFLHSVAFTFFLTEWGKEHPLTSFFAGAGIFYGAYEIYSVYVGHYTGWLAFSRILSSLPIAAVAIVAMVRSPRQNQAMGWLGAVMVAWLVGLQWLRTNAVSENSIQPLATQTISAPFNLHCGASELYLAADKLEPLDTVSISSCGLSPSTGLLQSSSLTVRNQLDQAINLHLVIATRNGNRSLWNKVIPAHATVSTPPSPLGEEGIGMLYSDSLPWVGIVGLKGASSGNWKLNRNPISLERLRP